MSPTPTQEELSFLNELKQRVTENTVRKGFRAKFAEGLTPEQWAGGPGQLIRSAVFCMNLVGEISEFWEAFRAGTLNEKCDKAAKMEAMGIPGLTCSEEEIADELIRVLDKADVFGVDVAKSVSAKMRYNSTRPELHGNKKA